MAIPKHDDEDGLANSLPKIHCAFLRIPPKKFTPGLDKPSHPEGSGWRGEEGKPLFRDFITFGKSGDRRTREKTKSLALPPTVISITRLDSKLPRKRKSLLHSVFFSLFQVRPNFFTKMRRQEKPS